MDKSDEFFDANYSEPVDPHVEDMLQRLQRMLTCFRNAFPEAQLLLNQTGNASSWNYATNLSDDETSGDSILHTVIILSIFCSIVLLLVVRSSRGGSWTSCKADIAAVSQQTHGTSGKKTSRHSLTEIERMHIERVPSWTQERPSFSSTIRVIDETDF